MANRQALTLCNRRTSHNFTDFCNLDSKVWKSYQDTLRSDSFLPYQKLAHSYCPPGDLQTQRNRLGHSKSYHPPCALVKLLSSTVNVNTGREFQIRDHITLQVRQYCNGSCSMPKELQASTDYAVATEDCIWMVMIQRPWHPAVRLPLNSPPAPFAYQERLGHDCKDSAVVMRRVWSAQGPKIKKVGCKKSTHKKGPKKGVRIICPFLVYSPSNFVGAVCELSCLNLNIR